MGFSMVSPSGRFSERAETMRVGDMRDLGALIDLAQAEFQKDYESGVERGALRFLLWMGFFLRLSNDDTKDHTVVIYEVNGKIKGMVELSAQPLNSPASAVPPPKWFKTRQGRLYPYLSNLLVASDSRKKGIGRKLVNFCEKRVRQQWADDSVTLHFDASDRGLRRFYQRLGFRISPSSRKEKAGAIVHFEGINLTYAVKRLKDTTWPPW